MDESYCSYSSTDTEQQAYQPPSKKRALTVTTVQKWIAENDKALNTATWLKYVASGRSHVEALMCSVCIKFKDKLEGMRNFKPGFIEGSRNLRASSFKDHAASDMHARAMHLLRKESSSSVADYAPIVQALHRLGPATEATMSKKFEVAYFVAKQNFAFVKFKPLCELLERQGARIGQGYKNDKACASFIHYIAEDLRIQLLNNLSKVNFFSVQSDTSTDSGNVEEELFLVLYFDPYTDDGMVCVHDKFLAVRQPRSCTGLGLFQCFESAMDYVGISDWRDRLVGYGCDGASANIALGGLRGQLTEEVPWLVMFWCLAHRLELSLNDSFKNTYFASIDEMLLRLYYLYEKSPKKCRELDDIVTELKACLDSDDFSHKGGLRPLRACGTRFVSHKVMALSRVLERFGAYLSHLCSLIEDPTVKSVDKQKLKGYALQWRNAKILVGCAFFLDLLKPASILCKVLQKDEICVMGAIEAFIKTKKSVEKIKKTPFDDLPNVKMLCNRVKVDASGTSYQGAEITNYDSALQYYKSKYSDLTDRVLECLRNRVKVQHIDLLTHVLTILTPIGWDKGQDGSFAHNSLEYLVNLFQQPLEKAKINITVIQEEWEDMVDYAKRYFNLVQESYRVIWWKLFNSTDSSKWVNILALVNLLFCLPVSNGKLERAFSLLKNIKGITRTSISEDRLDELLRIAEGPELSQWNPTSALKLWWEDKTRRAPSDARAPRKSASPSGTGDDEQQPSTSYTLDLQDWDKWMNSDFESSDDSDTITDHED